MSTVTPVRIRMAPIPAAKPPDRHEAPAAPVVISGRVPEGTSPDEAIRQIVLALAGEPKSDSRLHKAKAELRGLQILQGLTEARIATVERTIGNVTGGGRRPR